jgi:hypothetical protein
MARIRSIKPEFWCDEKLSTCDPMTRLVFLGLIGMADDRGRLLDNEKVIDAFIFPNTLDTARESVANLSRMGRVRRGNTASGQRIVEIVNWERHQKVDKPQLKAALPEIVEPQEVSAIRESVANESRMAREPVALHINDLLSTINYPLSTINVPPDGGAPVADAPVAPKERRGRPPRETQKAPAFPNFPQPLCENLYGLWISTFGAFDYGRFRKTLGPLFTIAEADRPPDAPTNAELAAALKSYADLAPMGTAARFANVNHAAGCLAAIARTRRDLAERPEQRADAVMRIIHGRPSAVAA